ncbi:LutC/YkgG family protein [Nitrosomonas sp.]|uniref:LutC/YkgG family protein n=1 Tax=Nitrosomonas sp. TaxID=42353 RepID=UPI001D98CCC2|nr:lactate utilization protein C [Nitrosomonas sp.]MBX3617725.1 lactate utilization protein C [Nitrosomonas sp.]
MNNARDNILKRLHDYRISEEIPADSDYASHHDWNTEERIKRFSDRMKAVHAEILNATADSWLNELASICSRKNLRNLLLSPHSQWGKQIAAQAERFPPLKYFSQPFEAWKNELFTDVDAAFTGAYAGIADTGTLIIQPSPDEPRSWSLVPPVHIAILEQHRICTTFTEAVARGSIESPLPSNLLLISGPSKSTDIEQTLAYGIHGPQALIVILV